MTASTGPGRGFNQHPYAVNNYFFWEPNSALNSYISESTRRASGFDNHVFVQRILHDRVRQLYISELTSHAGTLIAAPQIVVARDISMPVYREYGWSMAVIYCRPLSDMTLEEQAAYYAGLEERLDPIDPNQLDNRLLDLVSELMVKA